ncbi:MAG: HAMP domain-containing histidine kinase [Gammaproteobacteria bacterium]|nr:HAMP domain-containing histidine kinase [Gammaproteobacteria bacterium]MCP5200309.1 HAMP domain-containing histidine kinase [Gammaproteobacteria bacterium]
MGLSLVLFAGFALALHHTLEIVESRYAGADFYAELHRVLETLRTRGAPPEHVREGFTLLLRRDYPSLAELPALRNLADGVHVAVDLAGKEYNVAKQGFGDDTVYLLQDLESDSLEITEQGVTRVVVVAGILGLLAAATLSLWLARLVIRPVTDLARFAGELRPDVPRPLLTSARAGPEIAAIAAALSGAIERYERAIMRERAFTRDVSHELRTALAVMSTTLEVVGLDPVATGALGARLPRLRSATEQMHLVCEAMLALARVERRNDDHRRERHRVGALVSHAIGLYEQVLQKRASYIALDVVEDFEITAPRGMLMCVLTNLVRNAAEHAEGTRIDVTVRPQGLTIRDDGRGFDEDVLPRAFQREFRGKDSTGEGLGLDIVLRICQHQGWRLFLTTAPRRGTQFDLHFD